MTLLETRLKDYGYPSQWHGNKLEYVMAGHVTAIGCDRQQANDKAFVERKLAMLGLGETAEETFQK